MRRTFNVVLRIAAVAALLGASAVVLGRGGALAKAPEKDKPDPPSVTAVSPKTATYTSTEGVTVTLQGTGFKAKHIEVFFGPESTPYKCKPAKVESDKVLTCEMKKSTLLLGQPQRFVVRASADEKAWVRSELSKVSFIPLGKAEVTSHSINGGKDAPVLQVQLRGAYFSVEGGAAPTVMFAGVHACRNVVLISPSEMFCALPKDIYDKNASALFTVTRAGEAPHTPADKAP